MKQLLLAATFLALAATLPAQDGEWEFRFGPRIIGATVDARYILDSPAVDGVETSVTGRMSSAYEGVGYNRGSDGTLLFVDPTATDAITGYNRFDLLWELGIEQGILPRTDTTRDAAVVYAIYRGRYRLPFTENESSVTAAGLPTVEQTIRGAILAGLAYSTVAQAPVTRELSGFAAEFAIEWGPSFLHNQLLGTAAYSRLTLTGSGFLPLLVLPPQNESNRFSLYLAGFAAVDWAYGPDVPLSTRETTGGRSLRGAPGGSVRGYGSGRFDSTLKAVGNLELRAALPSLVLPDIVPGIVVFTDAGYYNDLDAVSPVGAELSGLLLSSGVGLSVDLFGLAALVFYTTYAWTGETRSNERWNPFGIGFGFHF